MPWCPKCKNEYKDGYTVCADCGSALVDSLEEGFASLYFGEKEELENMCRFMEANGICDTKIEYDEKEEIYELFVDRKDAKEAGKQLRVYLSKVAKKEEEEQSESQQEVVAAEEEYSTPYQEADKKAEEYRSGANTLLIVGVLGIVALILLNMGIIPISLTGFSKVLVTGVMGVMFFLFVILGISSRRSYQKLQKQAGTEKDTKENIRTYLKENIDKENFDNEFMEEEPSMEFLYFRRIEKMKEMIVSQYPDLEASFTDYIIEEVYPEIFEV